MAYDLPLSVFSNFRMPKNHLSDINVDAQLVCRKLVWQSFRCAWPTAHPLRSTTLALLLVRCEIRRPLLSTQLTEAMLTDSVIQA